MDAFIGITVLILVVGVWVIAAKLSNPAENFSSVRGFTAAFVRRVVDNMAELDPGIDKQATRHNLEKILFDTLSSAEARFRSLPEFQKVVGLRAMAMCFLDMADGRPGAGHVNDPQLARITAHFLNTRANLLDPDMAEEDLEKARSSRDAAVAAGIVKDLLKPPA